MSKMIDGNKLILSLSDWWFSSFGLEETEESKAIHKVLDMIERYVEHEKSAGEWIPCSEGLPIESGRYIVTHPLFTRKDKWLNIMYFGKPSMPNIEVKGKCWYMSDDEYGDVVCDDVLAWMPLPEPYKGGDTE